jgi:hypothetical protein
VLMPELFTPRHERASQLRPSLPKGKLQVGTGKCTECDCPAFKAEYGPGPICINTNSAGGTCDHTYDEHK